MADRDLIPARRVIVGADAAGASMVVSDAETAETALENGIVIQEIWQQRTLPAEVDSLPPVEWSLGPASPAEGAVVRILTVPAGHGGGAPAMHSDPSLHVITMIDGVLDVYLDAGPVTLRAGESIVLRDSRHDLANPRPAAARFVYTSFPLTGGPSSQ